MRGLLPAERNEVPRLRLSTRRGLNQRQSRYSYVELPTELTDNMVDHAPLFRGKTAQSRMASENLISAPVKSPGETRLDIRHEVPDRTMLRHRIPLRVERSTRA